MAQTLRADGARTTLNDSSMQQHGVECVGNVSFHFAHPLLETLAETNGDYAAVKNGVYLTGFKLESTLISSQGAIDNSKLVPLLNGDTMTLTNANKSGTLSIACTRTAAGLIGGDMVAVFDFIRTQGDNDGGTLTVQWLLNGRERSLTFLNVTVRSLPPIILAGNDLPDYQLQLNYSTYRDSEFPSLT